MEDTTKTVKCLKDSALLIKGVSENIQNQTKEKKADSLIWYTRYKFIKKYVNKRRNKYSEMEKLELVMDLKDIRLVRISNSVSSFN